MWKYLWWEGGESDVRAFYKTVLSKHLSQTQQQIPVFFVLKKWLQ